MFQLGVVVTVACIALYWLYRAVASAPGRNVPSFVLLVAVLGLLTLLVVHEQVGQQQRTYVPADKPPLVVGIAVDLSLSMLAAPDPRTHPDVKSRLLRVQDTLVTLFDRLAASQANVLTGVTAFTARSEIILAWDPNLAPAREVIAYVLAPDMMTLPGTDLGAAVEGLLPLFDLLPSAYREKDTRRVAIVVSDGEGTVTQRDLRRALDGLRARGVEVVSLQAGLFGVPEGIPSYDDAGGFLGFQDVGGQTYTTPDARAMQMIAGEAKPGLYVRAEDPQAASKIDDFLGVSLGAASGVERLQLLILWVLWGMTVLIMARLLLSLVPQASFRRIHRRSAAAATGDRHQESDVGPSVRVFRHGSTLPLRGNPARR
jgi:hypothetical protein